MYGFSVGSRAGWSTGGGTAGGCEAASHEEGPLYTLSFREIDTHSLDTSLLYPLGVVVGSLLVR